MNFTSDYKEKASSSPNDVFEQINCTVNFMYNFQKSVLNSIKPLTVSVIVQQGLLVAVLYCFANGEVRLLKIFEL